MNAGHTRHRGVEAALDYGVRRRAPVFASPTPTRGTPTRTGSSIRAPGSTSAASSRKQRRGISAPRRRSCSRAARAHRHRAGPSRPLLDGRGEHHEYDGHTLVNLRAQVRGGAPRAALRAAAERRRRALRGERVVHAAARPRARARHAAHRSLPAWRWTGGADDTAPRLTFAADRPLRRRRGRRTAPPSPHRAAATAAAPITRRSWFPTRDGVLWRVVGRRAQHVYVSRSADGGRPSARPVRVNARAGDDRRQRREPAEARGRPARRALRHLHAARARQALHRRHPLLALDRRRPHFDPPRTINDDGLVTGHRFDALAVGPDGDGARGLDRQARPRGGEGGARALRGRGALLHGEPRRGREFAPNRKLKDKVCECCRIAAVFDPAGDLVLAWRDILPGSVRDHAFVACAGRAVPDAARGHARRLGDRGLPAPRPGARGGRATARCMPSGSPAKARRGRAPSTRDRSPGGDARAAAPARPAPAGRRACRGACGRRPRGDRLEGAAGTVGLTHGGDVWRWRADALRAPRACDGVPQRRPSDAGGHESGRTSPGSRWTRVIGSCRSRRNQRPRSELEFPA